MPGEATTTLTKKTVQMAARVGNGANLMFGSLCGGVDNGSAIERVTGVSQANLVVGKLYFSMIVFFSPSGRDFT